MFSLPSSIKKVVGIALATAVFSFSANTAYAKDSEALNRTHITSFSQAKAKMPAIYKRLNYSKTFYCGCDFANSGKRFGLVDLKSCGYKVRKNAKRALRIEAEHIMPAYNFGRNLQCWQNGGRKKCNKNPTFKLMEGDLHNLVPAIGEVNGDRNNFDFSIFTKENSSMYGKCTMEVSFKDRIAQPPVESRGFIARAYLYMADSYGVRLSKAQQKLMTVWDKMYPPTEFECKRNDLIKSYQGNDNKFITRKCK